MRVWGKQVLDRLRRGYHPKDGRRLPPPFPLRDLLPGREAPTGAPALRPREGQQALAETPPSAALQTETGQGALSRGKTNIINNIIIIVVVVVVVVIIIIIIIGVIILG